LGIAMVELSPEERRKIYEEEKASIESFQLLEEKRLTARKRKASVIASSSYSIAISLILLIAFNFFNRYIALYRPDISGDTLVWIKEPILTSGFNTWLLLLTITLILNIMGYIFIIILKKYVWQESIILILNLIGIAIIVALFYIYPFDFSLIKDNSWAEVLPVLINILLGIIGIGMIIGFLVRSIKFIIIVTTKTYNE
jgi:hypothetical protein